MKTKSRFIEGPKPETHSFTTEEAARAYAKTQDGPLAIIHSPHPEGEKYYVEAGECPFIRSWETEVYVGDGRGGMSNSLTEHAERTWPAKNGHKAGCCAYYELHRCACQNPNWKPSSAGNYPSNPNPPEQRHDCRDRD